MTDSLLTDLESGSSRPLRDYRGDLDAKYRTGVYTLWKNDRFLYTGIAYRASMPSDEPDGQDGKWGIWGRLGTHLRARSRSFTRKVLTRFVVPGLAAHDLAAMERGEADHLLDNRVREWISANVHYRILTTESGDQARQLETRIRRDGLPRSGRPEFNPASR